jgi:hypothetical protein
MIPLWRPSALTQCNYARPLIAVHDEAGRILHSRQAVHRWLAALAYERDELRGGSLVIWHERGLENRVTRQRLRKLDVLLMLPEVRLPIEAERSAALLKSAHELDVDTDVIAGSQVVPAARFIATRLQCSEEAAREALERGDDTIREAFRRRGERHSAGDSIRRGGVR